jgi:hypothetical protein
MASLLLTGSQVGDMRGARSGTRGKPGWPRAGAQASRGARRSHARPVHLARLLISARGNCVTSEAAVPDGVNETVGDGSGRGASRAACVAARETRPGGAG